MTEQQPKPITISRRLPRLFMKGDLTQADWDELAALYESADEKERREAVDSMFNMVTGRCHYGFFGFLVERLDHQEVFRRLATTEALLDLKNSIFRQDGEPEVLITAIRLGVRQHGLTYQRLLMDAYLEPAVGLEKLREGISPEVDKLIRNLGLLRQLVGKDGVQDPYLGNTILASLPDYLKDEQVETDAVERLLNFVGANFAFDLSRHKAKLSALSGANKGLGAVIRDFNAKYSQELDQFLEGITVSQQFELLEAMKAKPLAVLEQVNSLDADAFARAATDSFLTVALAGEWITPKEIKHAKSAKVIDQLEKLVSRVFGHPFLKARVDSIDAISGRYTNKIDLTIPYCLTRGLAIQAGKEWSFPHLSRDLLSERVRDALAIIQAAKGILLLEQSVPELEGFMFEAVRDDAVKVFNQVTAERENYGNSKPLEPYLVVKDADSFDKEQKANYIICQVALENEVIRLSGGTSEFKAKDWKSLPVTNYHNERQQGWGQLSPGSIKHFAGKLDPEMVLSVCKTNKAFYGAAVSLGLIDSKYMAKAPNGLQTKMVTSAFDL
ncbi:hypothetical protein HNP46_000388 [Pseudomonas nitritireducens]|uniref:Uncharacterized protein n=1 Tax=Pseudomonas nitroreducens TaxID=46680 RepID=A0A7W7NZT9_PSENT|nr:hypothetical protein [Pseudomonas nitritireducens]MBB4861577.1 hypothetical protein [Pseudomonas nitritireducens]